jgi:hypothetical protein
VIGLINRAIELAEQLISRLDRLIEVLDRIEKKRDHDHV